MSSVFARPGTPAQQAVPAGEQAGEHFAAHLLLSDDDPADFGIEAGARPAAVLERQGGRVPASGGGVGVLTSGHTSAGLAARAVRR